MTENVMLFALISTAIMMMAIVSASMGVAIFK
jgi:hypothetical protein